MAVLTLGTLRALSSPLAEPGLIYITHIQMGLSSFRRESTGKFSSQSRRAPARKLQRQAPVLLLRALPTSHGGQTSRPTVQNGGMGRNGLKEINLMSIKDGMLVIMANGIIGSTIHGV